MELHTLSGSLGTGIVIGGYISQVARLVRTHRTEGVSVRAYVLWAVASGLLLVHARGMRQWSSPYSRSPRSSPAS